MQASLKWLLVPPAVAVVLLVGPLGKTDPSGAPASQAVEAPAGTARPAGTATAERSDGGAPALPGTFEVFGTLLGVLLLGGSLLFLFSKLRRNSFTHGGAVLTLRQSVRLSSRHSIHAIQYDERILVLGECGGNLTLLCSAADPDQDAASVAGRSADPDEDGAVPRDLVLTPRPRKDLPRPPVGSARTVPAERAVGNTAAQNPLNDFRTLLKKVGSAVGGR